MSPKRIAVIGAGLIGRRHVEAIHRCGQAVLSAIVDPAAEALTFAAEHGVPCVPDLETLLADPPDGAILATPNHLHVPQALDCVAAGVPLLIEKPIADDAASAVRLVATAEAAGVPLLVGHHRRHNPIIAAAKARIDGGALGRIVSVHAAFWLCKPADYFDTAWRTKKGAGPVFINLIHDIDLMRFLIGEVVLVQAIEANAMRGYEVEDTAAILLKFANGALGTVTVSDTIVAPWSWELTAAENPAYPATGQTCYQIGGTRGSLEIPSGRFWSQTEPRGWWAPIDQSVEPVAALDQRDPLDLQIAHFCDVMEGAPPLVSGAEALRSLRVVEAVKEAARRQSAIQPAP